MTKVRLALECASIVAEGLAMAMTEARVFWRVSRHGR